MKRMFGKVWMRLGPNDFIRTVTVGALGMALAAAGVAFLVWRLSQGLPSLDQLRDYEPRLTTRILDRRGELLTELFTERRLRVPLERVPAHAVNAIIATEDARFWRHWGLDLVRICGAALADLTSLSLKQGASTITQQLARDLYLTKRRTFGRKLRETLTAIQIERHYSKREILEMYLTQIYFGHGAYGIASAASRYFDKRVEDLTLGEAALLAGLPKAPGYYSPVLYPERAKARRDVVLRRMLAEGFISREEFERVRKETVRVRDVPEQDPLGTAPYFTEMVRQKLSAEGRRLGFDYLKDGLTVRTTLDARLQRYAEAAVDSHLLKLQSEYRARFLLKHRDEVVRVLYGGPPQPGLSWAHLQADSTRVDSAFSSQAVVQVALIALDPKTGEILALVGGRDFSRFKFNRAVQAIRQPGSVFKPFVYTAAVDNGYPPTYQLLNQDVVLTLADGTRWVPQNYDGSHGGPTTLREALRRSLNLVTVRLIQDVVPPRLVVKYAHQMGITTPLDAVDALALGASGVIPLDVAAAFAVFANRGIYTQPFFISRIEDKFGEEILSERPVSRVALPPETAFIMTDMLQTAIDRGTGASARSVFGFTATAAGKTGTTNDFTDAWFAGFTPRLLAVVWVGLDDPAESLGPGMSGAVAALPIWARFMKMAYDSLGIPDENFVMPPGVVRLSICDQTKQIATPYCPVKVTEVFRQDARPLGVCRKHQGPAGW